jgi:hypothetical protein
MINLDHVHFQRKTVIYFVSNIWQYLHNCAFLQTRVACIPDNFEAHFARACSDKFPSCYETYDFTLFITNPAAQMMGNLGKLLRVSLFFISSIIASKVCIVLAILLLRSLNIKIQATVKACA